jgi:type VI secretion system protein ImpA
MAGIADTVAAVLLSPVDRDCPCGLDLEYDADFHALAQASAGSPEQQFGDTLIPAIAPDWRQVEQASLALFSRTKDLRVMACLTQAWTGMRGLEGYADGVELVAGMLEQFWETLHPQLEYEGLFDPLPRCSAIAAFTDIASAGGTARIAPLLTWKSAQRSLRDAAALLGNARPQSDDIAAATDLRATLAAMRPDLGAVPRALAALERIRSLVESRLGTEWMPATDAVERPLKLVLSAIASGAAPGVSAASHAAPALVPDATPLPVMLDIATSPISGMPALNLSLKARDDVILVLEHVCAFLERTEPAHPAPLLIRRAQRLLPMTFTEIIRDMVPDALGHVRLLSGTESSPAAS